MGLSVAGRWVLIAAAASVGAGVAGAQASGSGDRLDPHLLPLGDGKISTAPQAGSVMACPSRFAGGGAQQDGPWISGDTFDVTTKLAVRGAVLWPDARFAVTTEGDERVVTRVLDGNGLPVDTPTGIFPIARDDPAFAIDRNPNSIRSRDVLLKLPAEPKPADTPSCVPMGMIGVALNGVAIYNALDALGRDAVAHEVQDACNGHPQMAGQYHYHGPSPCLADQTANETLIGYALDGFGIYSMYDADGRELTNADLDACHGRVSTIEWNGTQVSMYHYVLTREYPYTIGCFRGTPVSTGQPAGPRPRLGPGPGGPPPGGRPRAQ